MFVDIEKGIELILAGKLVATPTETVYGLAGDATSDKACLAIYEAKNRPRLNPLIIHVSSLVEAEEYAIFNGDAKKIAREFWPGPLTLVLPKKKSRISNVATANLDTIAIRVPAHEVIQSLITKTGKPLAAPSANVSSRISPTSASHVNKNFSDNIAIIDGGQTIYGIESTIVDCCHFPTLLRYGFITKDIISDIISAPLDVTSSGVVINAPGMLKKHYSPLCPIRINVDLARDDEIAINFGDSKLKGILNFNLSESGNLIEAAANLYAMLQKAEDYVNSAKHSKMRTGIAVASIPKYKIGLAINDKLERAASN